MLFVMYLLLVIIGCVAAQYGYQPAHEGQYQQYPQPGPYHSNHRYGNQRGYNNALYPSYAEPYPQPDYQDYGRGGYYYADDGFANDPVSLKSSSYHQSQSNYQGQSGGYDSHTKYVPVVVKTKKKKQKIISIDKGFYIAGGAEMSGKFKSLKACMKACAASALCMAGDYNPWLGKCYMHSYNTACGALQSHSKITHFKKIPCITPTDSSNTLVLPGMQVAGGLLQKGIDSLADCMKKCINAGTGIADTPAMLGVAGTGGQRCFAIDYDFSTHKCFFHTQNELVQIDGGDNELCPVDGAALAQLNNHVVNPVVVNMLFCPT